MKSSPLSRSVSILLHSIAGLAALPVVAATVTWDAPQAVTGDSDVKTLYALDRAHVFGATTTTVNGVPFKAWYGAGDTSSMSNQFGGFGTGAPFSSLSTSYQTLLTNGFYGNGDPQAITLNNLASGLDYQVQFWVNDSRDCCSNRAESVSGSAPLAYSTLPGAIGGVGSHVTGVFTADGPSQTLTTQPVGVNLSSQVNGLQLRAIGVAAGGTATLTVPKNFTTLSAGAGATINFNFPTDQWQSTVITGAGSLQKSGAGTLILTSAQAYTGATTISGGTLRIGTPSGPAAGSSLWLDASNAATVTTVANTVTQWNDAGGGGNFLTIGGGTPTLQSNALNGRPVVDLGAYGSGNWMVFNQDMPNIQSAFWVTRAKGFLLGSTTNYEFHRGPTGGGQNYSDALWDASNGWSSPRIRGGQTFLNGLQVDGTVTGLSSEYTLISMVTNGGGVQANALANDRNIPGRQGGQQIGEIILFNTPLGSIDRVKTEAYLGAKWFAQGGATNNVLPATTAVTIAGGGKLDLADFNQTIGSLSATDASNTEVLLGAGRLTISGANHTTFDGVISGTGGITKEGVGTLTLAGANTYTGMSDVKAGKLLVTGSLAAGSGVTVGSAATFGGSGTVNGATVVNAGGTIEASDGILSLSALTLSGAAAFRVETAAGSSVNVTTPNGLVASGGAGSAIIHITGAAPAIGTHPLINYDGTLGGGIGAFALGTLPNRVLATLNHNAASTLIQLTVTATDFPIWSGAASGAWTTASVPNPKNWVLNSNNGTSTDFLTGDNVVFNNLGTITAVMINGAHVTPATVVFNATKNYTFTGTHGIAGSTSIEKNGTGNVTLGTPNTFTGPVNITAGTVIAGHPDALGATASGTTVGNGATLDLNGIAVGAEPLTISGIGATGTGVLVNTNVTAASLAGDVVLAGPTTIGGSGDSTLTGAVSGGATLTKTGTGRLNLAGANTLSGQILLNQGTLRASHSAALGIGGLDPATGTVIANGAALEFANNSAVSEQIRLTGAGVGGTGAIRSVSGNNAVTTTVALDANATIGVDSGTFSIDAAIYHDTGPFSLTKVGAGTLALNAANTFTGGLTVNAGIVKTGLGNALSSGPVLVNDGGSIDLNGQTIANNNISINGPGADPAHGAFGNASATVNLNALQNLTLHGDASIGGNGGRWDIARADFTVDPNNTTPHIFGNGHVLTKVGTSYVGILGGALDLAAVVINGGTLAPHDNTSLGAGPVVVNTGATLQPWAGLLVNNALVLNGGTLQTDGFTDTYAGGVAIGANGGTFNTVNGDIVVNSVITGGGQIVKSGVNTLWLTATNTATGNVVVTNGRLRLGSPGGPTVLGNVNFSGGSFTLTDAPNQFSPTTVLNFTSVGNYAELALLGNSQVVAGISAASEFAVIQNSHQQIGNASANSILTINQNTDTVFAGYIRNNTGNDGTTLGITKGGTGKLTLAGSNLTYTGPTTVNGGTLEVNGPVFGSAFTLNGGTLSGVGPVGPVTANSGSTISPGNSPGILSTGALTMGSGSTLAIEINGLTAGTEHDQLNVSGLVNLSGATLSLSGSYLAAPGATTDLFTVLLNDGFGDLIVGTFAGLPEGTLFTAPNGQPFKISYIGGDGNDVVLTAIPEPGSAVLLLGGLALLARRRRK